MHATQSIAWLKSQICTATAAAQSLTNLNALLNVVEVFREFFPREFKKYAQGINQENPNRIIVEFLGLVHGRLFELNEVYLEDEESYAYACHAIPISSFTPDWYNQDPSDLPLAYRIILLLDGDLEICGHKDEVLSRFSPTVQQSLNTAAPVDISKLKRVCERTTGPLRDLYLAFEMVYKTSPNIWLNISDEEYSEIPWDIKEVRELARQYREAIALMARFRRFESWLEADPEKRIPKVLDLWSKARRKERVKVKVAGVIGEAYPTPPVRVLI